MRKQKQGSIINISSYLVRRPVKGAGSYVASKAALASLTKTLALEEGRFGIRVNSILPGFQLTGLNEAVWAKFEKEIRGAHLLKNMPQLDGVAEFVYSISSHESITGQEFAFESRI